ncbi:MAG: hypothetical protein ACK4HQ_05725 [Brevinematales bacterium]
MRISGFSFLMGVFWLCIMFAYAETEKLVIQQVGIEVRSVSGGEEIAYFIEKALLGYSDRQKLRIVKAQAEDLSLLKVSRLSGVVSVFLRYTNGIIYGDVSFFDSRQTNVLQALVSFAVSNWMDEIDKKVAIIASEMYRHYPPKPVKEHETIDVSQTFSPYEVRGHEFSTGLTIGFGGRAINFRYAFGTDGFSSDDVVKNLAFDVLLLWRYRLWYVEGGIHVFPFDELSVLTETEVGYGFFGGVIAPLGGLCLGYDEHYVEVTNTVGSKITSEFATVHVFPLLGVRVSFQPNFWVNMVIGGFPSEVPHRLWSSEGILEGAVFDSMFARIQLYFRYGQRWMFLLSWKTWSTGYWSQTGYQMYPENISFKDYRLSGGSLSIGGAYVF